MVGIGMISGWHVHADGYAREAIASGKATIKAVWDEDAGRGKARAASYGAEFVADYGEFLSRGDVSAVICGSPTTMHPELIGKAAAAKKHIFTEKVLATSTADCGRLCKEIGESGVIFAISLPLLSDAKVLYVKRLVGDGLLGRVTGARMRRSHSGVSDHWLPEYWFDESKTGGGAMMDLGAHAVYILGFLLGEPKRLSAVMTKPFGTSSDENAWAVVEFEGGAIGSMETAFVTYGVPDLLEVYGTEGSVFVHGDRVLVSQKSLAGLGAAEIEPCKLPCSEGSPLLQFIEACEKGVQPDPKFGLAAALRMTKIMEAAYNSDKSGAAAIF